MHHNIHQFILLSSILFGNFLSSETYFVNNKADYYQVTKNLNAGDTVVLENGIWNDFEILFEGQGTENEPIQLKAQTNGQVFITGKSNLKIAGTYIIVSGLIFKDGYTPTNSVIEFRKNKYELANNSRITEIVIDNIDDRQISCEIPTRSKDSQEAASENPPARFARRVSIKIY